MTLIHNAFAIKPEVVFVTYDEVVKTPYPIILNQILTRYKSQYEEYLNFLEIHDYDLKNLIRFCIQRTKKNVFHQIARKKFDWDTSLKEIKDKFFDIYTQSDLLSVGEGLVFLINQKFTKKVYIYTEEYDVRVHLDIQRTYHDMRMINYITGPFEKTISSLDDVTSYILNDADYIPIIFKNNKANYTEILMANYGYNLAIKSGTDALVPKIDMESYTKDHIFKFGIFMPLNMDESYFSKLVKG